MDTVNVNINVIFIFKSVYKLQETQATKALGRLERRLTVPTGKQQGNKFPFSVPPPAIEPGFSHLLA